MGIGDISEEINRDSPSELVNQLELANNSLKVIVRENQKRRGSVSQFTTSIN